MQTRRTVWHVAAIRRENFTAKVFGKLYFTSWRWRLLAVFLTTEWKPSAQPETVANHFYRQCVVNHTVTVQQTEPGWSPSANNAVTYQVASARPDTDFLTEWVGRCTAVVRDCHGQRFTTICTTAVITVACCRQSSNEEAGIGRQQDEELSAGVYASWLPWQSWWREASQLASYLDTHSSMRSVCRAITVLRQHYSGWGYVNS